MQVLFLDSVHPILEEALTANGFTCHHDHTGSYSTIKDKIGLYQGLVVRSRIPIDAALLEQGQQLKWIARSGSGLENIDLASAKMQGIEVYSSPEGNSTAVGEHAIGMLLMLFNKLHTANAQVKSGTWNREQNRGIELAGLTVGILGYGHMGRSFAAKLQGFGCRVLAYDKYVTLQTDQHVEASSRAELMAGSDVVSIHLPLSEETKHCINSGFIKGMGKPFFLINTARGQHVDTAALVQGLQSGKVRGACLDVLEYEKRSLEGLDGHDLPSTFRALCESEKVVLSPHVAGWTAESYIKLSSVLAQKILGQHTA